MIFIFEPGIEIIFNYCYNLLFDSSFPLHYWHFLFFTLRLPSFYLPCACSHGVHASHVTHIYLFIDHPCLLAVTAGRRTRSPRWQVSTPRIVLIYWTCQYNFFFGNLFLNVEIFTLKNTSIKFVYSIWIFSLWHVWNMAFDIVWY